MEITKIYDIKSANSFSFNPNTTDKSNFENILKTNEQQSDLMYYLQLQMQIMKLTCQYQALSNIMKAQFDSAINAIRNIR